MPAFTRILVAVDGSPAAAAALDEAIEIARDDDAELVLTHVTSLGEGFMPNGRHPNRVPDEATTTTLAAALERTREAGVRASTELVVGYAPRQLALVADDRDVDLLVVGSRRLKGLKRAVLGSTSRELLKETTRPVLIVPAPAETREEVPA